MIDSIRDRDVFVRLGHDGTRFRVDTLWCTYLPDPAMTGVGVAFAIGRTYGSAVMRNRLRRRLRVILRDLDMPAGWWLFGARPNAGELTFADLRNVTTALVSRVSLSFVKDSLAAVAPASGVRPAGGVMR